MWGGQGREGKERQGAKKEEGIEYKYIFNSI
jgi:hypothetical protein